MRIDTHVHMPSKIGIWGIPYFSGSQYLDFMDENGIDKSFILPLDGLFFDAHDSNEDLAHWCDVDRSRLVPFFTFEPRDPKALDEITRCYDEFGMQGVKLHTWLQGFRPTEECFLPLAERLEELGLPVLFHDGTPPYSTPLQIAELARHFSDLKIILGHGGLYDFGAEAIMAVKLHKNISISMTSLPTGLMHKLIEEVDINQLMFGSDGGLNSLEKHSYVSLRWAMYDSLNLNDSQKKSIEESNPIRIVKGAVL